MEINPLHCYIHLLKQCNALVPCDNSLKRFVLQDFDIETMSLKLIIYSGTPPMATPE